MLCAQESVEPILLLSSCFVVSGLADVQAQALGVEVDLVLRLFKDRSDIPCVLEFSEIHVTPALLDGVTDQLCGTCLTLCAHDGGLLLLSCFVDDECGTLRFLLGDLLCLDGGCELGGEGEMLWTC